MTVSTTDDGEIVVGLLPKQAEALASERPSVAYVGGIGAGKTEVGALWIARDVVRYPGGVHCVTALTYDQLDIVIRDRLVAALAAFGTKATEHRAPWRLECDNGARVLLRSVDRPEPLQGVELDRLWTDEADFYKPAALRTLRERMRGRRTPEGPRWLATSSPNGFRELWRIFVKEAEALALRREFPRTQLIVSRTEDNWHLDPEYVRNLRDAYAAFPGLADQQLDGKFVAVGAHRVCPNFDRAKHVRAIERNVAADVVASFDFNVDRIVCHLIQTGIRDDVRGPRHVVQVWRTIRAPHLDAVAEALLRDLAIRTREGRTVYPPRFDLHGDAPQGALRSTQTGRTSWSYLRDKLAALAPVPCYPSSNPLVVDRVNATNLAFGRDLVEVDASCVDLIEDLEKCQWDKSGAHLDGSDPERTHAFDALGYYLHAAHRPSAFRAPSGGVDYDLREARP